MRTQTLFLVICCCLLSSCSCVTSSYYYTKGTEQLECGNYSEAIIKLEKAVKYAPEMARNHTNLATAYFANKDEEKAWYHYRQAARCPYDDGISKPQFLALFNFKVVQPGLNQPGTNWEEISKKLGEPDEYQENESGEMISCSYGTCKMFFSNGLLTRCLIQ